MISLADTFESWESRQRVTLLRHWIEVSLHFGNTDFERVDQVEILGVLGEHRGENSSTGQSGTGLSISCSVSKNEGRPCQEW